MYDLLGGVAEEELVPGQDSEGVPQLLPEPHCQHPLQGLVRVAGGVQGEAMGLQLSQIVTI